VGEFDEAFKCTAITHPKPNARLIGTVLWCPYVNYNPMFIRESCEIVMGNGRNRLFPK
jgi:hypothetical protein